MRILPSALPSEGYEPGSVELNHEEGILDISYPSSGLLLEESKIVAETLVLRCGLHPVPLFNKGVKVQLISEGDPLKEALLYDEDTVSLGYGEDIKNSQWQGIALEYTGFGRGFREGKEFFFNGATLPSAQLEEKNPLYVKPFRVEIESYQSRRTTLTTGQILTSPPGTFNVRLLRGYGGYYQPGAPLTQIEQVYYDLTGSYNRTQVRLYTTPTLQAQHTPPPRGGAGFTQEILFDSTLKTEEYLSFLGALAAGYAKVDVITDWGCIPYSSYLCEEVPGCPGFANVYFRS